MAAVDVELRDLAAMQARVVVVSKPPGHRVLAVLRARVDKGPDVVAHRLETHSPAAMKAVLPVARWASHVLPARHRVDNRTPCAPASI
jgi:hypothetical protein